MILYHFTSPRYLRSIARHGLTVGDVPTDIERGLGRIGVWLTSAETAFGHGLETSTINKSECRLSIEVRADSPMLVKWSEWAPLNVAAATIRRLHAVATGHENWYIFFGIIQPTAISSCVKMSTRETIPNWAEVSPPELDLPGVPPWRREAWHRALLKKVERGLKSRSLMSPAQWPP
jgi:hypothetical protein